MNNSPVVFPMYHASMPPANSCLAAISNSRGAADTGNVRPIAYYQYSNLHTGSWPMPLGSEFGDRAHTHHVPLACRNASTLLYLLQTSQSKIRAGREGDDLMDRALKWVFPALVIIEIGLVQTGILSLKDALFAVVGVEILLAVVAGRQIITGFRRYRANRAAGFDPWQAVEEGLTVFVPRKVARVISLEPKLWAYLWQWIFRRRPPNPDAFAYRKRSIMGVLLIVAVLTAPGEILLWEILIPWNWPRLALLVLSLYALLWIFAFYASLSVLPHRLNSDFLRLHYGALAEGRIPYSSIDSVEVGQRKTPDGREGLRLSSDRTTAHIGVGGKTDVTIHLREPLALSGLLGPTSPVTTVCVAVDEPERLARELGVRIEAETGSHPTPELV